MARVSQAVAAALLASACYRAAALHAGRPKGARRRARERADRRLFEGEEPAPTAPPRRTVYCPPEGVALGASQEGVCQPSTRTAAVAALRGSFDAHHRASIAAAFEGSEAGAYLTIGSWREGPLLGNWLAHAWAAAELGAKRGAAVVSVALDEGAMTGCENFRASLPGGIFALRCVSLAGWLPRSLLNASSGEARAGNCESGVALWARPLILQAAVEASTHPVFLVSTDVVVRKDMMGLGDSILLSGKRQMAVAAEGNGKLNTDAVFATKASLNFLGKWADQAGQCFNSPEVDKSALQQVVHNGGMGKLLGTFYASEIGQCMRRGEFATHFNCAGKRTSFVMKGMHDWVEGMTVDPKQVMRPGQTFDMALHHRNHSKKKA